MKINIFKISPEHVEQMLKKFNEPSVQLMLKDTKKVDDWTCDFYLSENPEIENIPWVKNYADILSSIGIDIENKIFFSAYICSKGDSIFVITHGKTHFYVRNYCESEFGLNLAKRIANEKDVKQVASKRFAGKKKKEVKSYTKNTKLDPESGESIDLMSASIVEEKKQFFGEQAKFGSSVLLSKKELKIGNITHLLDKILETIEEAPAFEIPKTEKVVNKVEIEKYDNELLSKLSDTNSGLSTQTDGHDIVGVDIVFSGEENYSISYPPLGIRPKELSTLDIDEIRNFTRTNTITGKNIFDISIKVLKDDQKNYSKKLKKCLDYTIEDENVILQNGEWIRFNEEYVNQLNEAVNSIEVEPTEKDFQEVSITEPIFNDLDKNTLLKSMSYQSADKNFEKLKLKGNSKIEAWDLRKDNTVYAVKFGTAQKLVYVCNQAIAALEVLRNKANIKKLDNPPTEYCLWLGFERENIPNSISEINSIILKQQIDTFARKCDALGIKPKLKFSKKISDKKVSSL